MSRFVRPSKYRHVYGSPAKNEVCYQNVKVTNNAWDTNLIAANKSYVALNWQAGGGGAFAVIPTAKTGKLPDVYPLCRGHTAAVLDTAFSPFDDSLVVSGADDGYLGVWKIDPSSFDVLDMSAKELERNGGVKDLTPAAKIAASSRKIGQVLFHPTASNVVAAAGGDYTIKLWDVQSQKDHSTLTGFSDAIQAMDFDWTGNTLIATCRDRKLRTFDARKGGAAVQTTEGHPGIKGSRVIWCGSTDRVITTGFSKTSDRQMFLWDSKNLTKPLKTVSVDTSSGVIMPFWSDNSIVFLAGKGDGNVRYYELENDELHYLSEYKSTDPQRGLTFLPRRDLNADENEIARAYKVTNNMVQPISFICPRRADSFQTDIFPPAPSAVPAMTSDDFFGGKSALPNLLNLQDGKGVSAEQGLASASASVSSAPAPAPAQAPAPAKVAEPTLAPAPTRTEPLPEPTRRAAAAPAPAPTPAASAPAPSPAPVATATKAEPAQTSSTLPALSRRENGASTSYSASPAASKTYTPSSSSSSTSNAGRGVTSGMGDLASDLQRLLVDSAARDARLRELEIENEKLKTNADRAREAGDESSSFSADRFFETQTPPSNLEEFGEKAREFVNRHGAAGRKVVLVTSGGTTVPLEQNVVRFLDNFSAGTRGATSAEYFLSQGYAVIFMHRQHSLSPYTRHYSHTTNPFLDLLEDPSASLDADAASPLDSSSSIRVNEAAVEGLRPVLQSYLSHARSPEQGGQGTLLRLPFVTVNEYLFLLREMSAAMGPLKRRGMYYLAAAVSDFFVPNQRTPQHKIQSSKGSLVIEMDQVPKVLRPMVQSWAPAAFIVSFKLETDADILIPKAEGALERYGHQVVVANDLARRKEEVCFVSRKVGGGVGVGGGEAKGSGTYEAKWLRLAKGEKNEAGGVKEIEEDIVAELLLRHQAWIEEGEREGSGTAQ